MRSRDTNEAVDKLVALIKERWPDDYREHITIDRAELFRICDELYTDARYEGWSDGHNDGYYQGLEDGGA